MLRWLGAPLQACFPALRRSGSSRNTMEPGTGPAPALPPRMQTEPGTGPAPSPAADSAKVLVEDAVFQLYAPAGEPAMDVVFFHGLQLGDYSKAWLTSWQADTDKPDGCWPSRLLAKDFPHARILSVAYDSSARGGNMDLFAIREQLAVLLMSAGVGKRPVAFVGHSLGGLVLKEVCNELHKQAQESPKHKQALGSVVGMAFYATPHAGSRLADAGLVKVFGSGAVMTYLRTLDTDAARLNGDFGKLKERQGWSTLGFGETMPTVKGPFGAVVVEEASARQQMDTFLQVPKSDHNTVCKPPTETAASYVTLKQYLDTQFNKRTKVV